MNILVELTEGLPVGTNLALLQFLWMLVSGALLPQRGALFPALKLTGLSDEATRRTWAALRGGVWQTAVLLWSWQSYIEGLPGWQELRYEGYGVVTADVAAFWRSCTIWFWACSRWPVSRMPLKAEGGLPDTFRRLSPC